MKAFAAGAAVISMLLMAPVSAPASRVFTDDFTLPVALGSFHGCDHNADTPRAYCSGLSGWYRENWWAYPDDWPDTATQRGYPVGGFYDPAHTVWADGGRLHLRMFRDATGPVHSAAIVPKALIGARYGTFSERFRVSTVSPGYKSAHLLWPVSNDSCAGCEIDFPEGEWTSTISAFTHPKGGGGQDSFDAHAGWSDWHTTTIDWAPGHVRYYLDGHLVGHSTRRVPDQPMTWVLQNESALDGDSAAPRSWAQIDIDWVRASTTS